LKDLAVGDSWFHYLPARLFAPRDILDWLNRSESPFNIQRTAAAGDTVENMIWGTGYWSNWSPQESQAPELCSWGMSTQRT